MTERSRKRAWAAIVVIAVLFLAAIATAFSRRPIHNDEAWIGQQVWSLVNHGVIVSELFLDSPPLDREIVVYHKQLVWIGAAVSKLAGWGLYQLRAISLVSGLLLLLLITCTKSVGDDSRQRLLTAAILALTPVFWLQMLEFRPEALLLLFGTASFLLLKASIERSVLLLALLSGILAGAAGLCHAFGFAYVIAGTLTALSYRHYKVAALVAGFGIAAFAPYLSGYLTNKELFLQQMFQNPLMTTSFEYQWWSPLLNLIDEHKRILRKPEVIGITILFILALFSTNRDFLRRHRLTLAYCFVLFVVIGASPLPKFTRYMAPLVPMMAIFVSAVILHSVASSAVRQKVASTALRAWLVIFAVYGAYSLGAEALQPPNRQIHTNELLAAEMEIGSTAIVPFDFVFMQQGLFKIRNDWGANRAAGSERTSAFLEHYAAERHVRYLILDPVMMAEWKITPSAIESAFSRYRLKLALPANNRYLFESRP
jgi:4-amino-4-deoxy-L-arabinose transferase-like glycosyltransferase